MNIFVADPQWGWWIIGYFFLGGIAAGCYFMATLIDLVGSKEDQELAKIGFRIAFPLIILCAVFLTLDLERPERFWHMLFRSEVVTEAQTAHTWGELLQAPMLKYWSPMSAGSWALFIFGGCSFISFIGSFRRSEKRTGLIHRAFQLVGCLVGFFVASYTGALLTATNQPVWSDSVWVAPLFLTSAASTGIAIMLLLGGRRLSLAGDTMSRMVRADAWALVLELLVFGIFLVSLGTLTVSVWDTINGKVMIAGVLIFGIAVPILFHMTGGLSRRPGLVLASLSALLAGFMLRYGIVSTPREVMAKATPAELEKLEPKLATTSGKFPKKFSPEDGRMPGDTLSSYPVNKTGPVVPRSKVRKAE
jgi:formate-dependent nitrite reductase membrane component NrfD